MSSPQEHDQLFGTLSPTPLFFRLAVPSMISMAVTSLYTIADGVFVGHFIGAGALAAVNLVMPLIMMSFALADMLAVGSAVQIAIRLGERREAEASKIFSFACGMILFISLVIGAAAFGLADGFLVSWCAVVSSSFFTALNRPFCSLVLSVCHTLVFPVLFLAILPNIWGLDGIWLTSLFAGSCTAVLAAGLIIWVVYQLKREPAAPHVSVTKKGVSADAAAS